jgi:hypothetical protein
MKIIGNLIGAGIALMANAVEAMEDGLLDASFKLRKK